MACDFSSTQKIGKKVLLTLGSTACHSAMQACKLGTRKEETLCHQTLYEEKHYRVPRMPHTAKDSNAVFLRTAMLAGNLHSKSLRTLTVDKPSLNR